MNNLLGPIKEPRYKTQDLLKSLHSNKYANIYEYDEWLDLEFYKYIKINNHTIINQVNDNVYYTNDQYYEMLGKDLMKLKRDDRNSTGIVYFKYLYDYFKENYSVETFKLFTGVIGKTKVYLYIKELETVILSPYFNKEDLLNLLLIKKLKIYIYDKEFMGNGEKSQFTLYEIIPQKCLEKTFNTKLKEMEIIKEKVKKRTSEVYPSKDADLYVSLNDKDTIIQYYNSLSTKEKRCLKSLYIDARGNKAITLVSSYNVTIQKLNNDILPLEIMIKNFNNLFNYENDNKTKIEKDHHTSRNQKFFYTKYYFQNNFTEYKLLVKEFDNSFKTMSKWLADFFKILGNNITSDYIDNGMTKGTIYCKIVNEIKLVLSKIWFVSEVIVFGSVARGTEQFGSDIDIAYKIGIGAKNITTSKRELLNNIVLREIAAIEEKYENLVPGYPKKYSIIKNRLISTLALSFQAKRQLDNYDNISFFNGSKTLFSRNKFEIVFGNYKEIIEYKDIDYAVIPTRIFNGGFSIYAVQELGTDEKVLDRFIKFHYENDCGQYTATDIYTRSLEITNGKESNIQYKKVKSTLYNDWPIDENKSLNDSIKENLMIYLYLESINRYDYDYDETIEYAVNDLGFTKV
ncbi:nucleotidyltransferase family protein [Clostridium estertheticum]|uniref:nucleotidyltransferase family protein n=1 Tax=Clostridium estertheticum TaxID=238834 RepID=UPI001C0D27CA|nr:nucleotidyltransferase domain-containing protein [Clostridium estertheticum]MBU3173339.1 nucleotidyltransferase domain-containing protein [Clostridium estertheticum]